MKKNEHHIAPYQKTTGFGHFGRAPFFSVMIIFLICIGGFVYYYRNYVAPVNQQTEKGAVPDKEDREKWNQETQKELEADLRSEIQEKAQAQDIKEIEKKPVPGWVFITDPWGWEVTKFRAAMSGEGWLALPSRACLAGKRWEFSPDDSGRKGKISGGLWVYGDSVGLWRIEKNTAAESGPELGFWNEKEPVAWSSLESGQELPFVKLEPGRRDGFFISSSLPDAIKEIGIFMQDGTIVGWSFGDWLEKGYMWKGQDGKELKERTWVSSFYNITFANGREEKFAMASSMRKDNDGIDQLAAFIDGFRLQPKLALEDTPVYLLPEEVIGKMRHIVTSVLHRRNESKVITMLNSQVLKNIGDIHLVMDVAAVIKSVYGYEAAIREIEDTGLSIIRNQGSSVPAFSKLHAELYREWLQSLVSEGSVDRGLQTFDAAKTYFSDDPYIHLLGVELEILNGDWEEAERLLYMRTYPPELQDRFSLLALRISEMKGEEEEIVVRFPSRSGRIVVTAVVNGTSYQEFLVDTGASMVTIPSSAVEKLGLEISEGYHGSRHSVSTAGGIVMASEVIIDAIEINGWIEYDVRALVLDMPDQPELGLLGLNYLSRFQVDLKPEEGVLKLTPR
jgi:clan AA aspartic protease (TIGR02281 family)